MFDEIIPAAVSSIGTDAFGDLAATFATGAVPAPQKYALMNIDGIIDIWPTGLGIGASLVQNAPPSTYPPPTYLRGHEFNREFHTETRKYGILIKQPVRFPTWMRAIELGYNGCWYCQPDYNVVAVGQLRVEVAGNFAPKPEVTAELVNHVQRFGVTVAPGVVHLRRRTRTYFAPLLVPGSWKVTITQEDWTITTTVAVGKAWRSQDQVHGDATVVHAEVGSTTVTTTTVPASL
ncbi:hypothetical protein ACIBEK_07095 [Nocardia fusca]|uniref:hypothetical protein n=1 Tax=Nocardia fusca TaxID=941183 RepID=UPI00379216D6